MKFIDINGMTGPWHKGNLRFSSPQELKSEMNRLGIEKTLAFDSRAWLYNPHEGNEYTFSSYSETPCIFPVPVYTNMAEFELTGHRPECCVRMFPSDHNYLFEPWSVDLLFSRLSGTETPVLLDCKPGQSGGRISYDSVFRVAQAFPKVPIVLLSIGYRSLRMLYPLMKKCENTFIDTSTFIPFRGIEFLVEALGAKRILFGTRMPFIDGGASIGRLLYANILTKDKELIAYGNAERIMNI